MPSSIGSQYKRLRRSSNSRNYSPLSSNSSLSKLEPIMEEIPSTKDGVPTVPDVPSESSSQRKRKSSRRSEVNNNEGLGNVTIEEIFFKEHPFRVCGLMKVVDVDQALEVHMTMQFTYDFWKSFTESPIVCSRTKFSDMIAFEVEIPKIFLQKSNIDFRVSTNSS